MRFSHRFIFLLSLLLASLPLYAQRVTKEAKSLRAIVSGIVSYTRWPAAKARHIFICAFCLIINNDEVKFSVNLDSLSHSGVRVNPEVLMLARNQKHE